MIHKHLLAAVLGVSTLLGTASAAWGHAIQTDYFVDLFSAELSLSFTATYSTGEPMENATVRIYAPGNRETPWLESYTDEAGQFTFLPDESLEGDWRLEFAQAGHQDILIVPVDAQGIDYSNISEAGTADVHYAQIAPAAIALLSSVSLAMVVFSMRRRQS